MKYILSLLAFVFFLSACQREPVEIIELEPPLINPSTNPVLGSLMGKVLSESLTPIVGAKVIMDGLETTTGSDGVFSFENVTLYSDGTYVTVDQPGYYQASRRFYALAGEINNVEIGMLDKSYDNNFDSSIGENISVDNVNLDFPAGDYALSANVLYSDEIKVSIASIPFGSENFSLKMPGDLTGSDEAFDLKAISNFGTFAVDLITLSGEKIDFPSELKAGFEYNLSEEFQSETNVSLWYFDQDNGSWLESGEAVLVDGSYVGEIDKTGYWMLGLAYDYADVRGSLIEEGIAIGNTKLDIHNYEKKYLSTFHTTRSGNYHSRVPQDIDLAMAIFHDCTVGRQNQELGIVHNDVEFEPLEVVMVMDNIEVQGNIKNCQGINTSRPYLKIDFGEEQYMYRCDDQGNFDLSFSNCHGEEVNVIAIDEESSSTSEVLLFPINNQINVGNVQTCNPIAAGYEIGYENMNWEENLNNTINHEWTVSRVSALEEKIIFSAKMFDENDGTLFLNAAFVFIEGESQVDYQLNFKTQGFIISGVCDLEEIQHDGITSYRFQGTNEEIVETSNGIYPGDVGSVNFNLVYYD